MVFTESITTQEYLRELLLDMGLLAEVITFFHGANEHNRATQAISHWQKEE